jgi:hypothetical protein
MLGRLVLVAVALVVTACGQPPPATPLPAAPPAMTVRPSPGLVGSFTDVRVLADGGEATLFYKTRTALRDCAAQRAEMPLVWHEHVRGRLADARWVRVTLFPEEPSGTSASFTFEQGESGTWRADAPCRVTIAN